MRFINHEFKKPECENSGFFITNINKKICNITIF